MIFMQNFSRTIVNFIEFATVDLIKVLIIKFIPLFLFDFLRRIPTSAYACCEKNNHSSYKLEILNCYDVFLNQYLKSASFNHRISRINEINLTAIPIFNFSLRYTCFLSVHFGLRYAI